MINKLKGFLRTSSDVEISEQERLLAAYFDGELSPAEAKAFKKQNLDILSVEQELEDLSELRSSFRGLVDDMYLQTKQGSGKNSIWQQIEFRILSESNSRAKERSFLQSLRPYFEPKAVFAGAAGLAMAFMFGVRFGSGELQSSGDFSKPLVVSQLSGVSTSEISQVSLDDSFDLFQTSPVSPNPNFTLVSASSSSRDSSIRLKVARKSGDREVSEHRIPLRVDTDQLIGVSPQPSRVGGLRTEGADIDWIESDRKFKILPANKKRVVPVIWVSRENNK